jgi:hypothetical protein
MAHRTLATWGLAAVLVSTVSPALAGPWTNANPGAGGAFVAIGAGPSGIILCGSDLGGAYRSLDHGQSWDAIGPSRGMDVAHVSAVGFDPADPKTCFLGTEHGVFRSTDSGQNFRRTTADVYIAAIQAAPSSSATVYVAYHPIYSSTTSGFYKSGDHGATWTTLTTNLPSGLRITKLIVHPTDPNTLYLVSSPDMFVPAALASIWKSTNGGTSWSRVGSSIGNVWDCSIDPQSPQTLYATTWTGTPRSSWSGSTWKSTDGGATWSVKGSHTGCVRVKADQPQTVWVVDPDRSSGEPESGCWISTDGGGSWSRKSSMSGWDSGWQTLDWAYGGDGYGMAKVFGQDLSNPSTLFWAHWQFAFATFDGGGKFQNLFTRQVSSGWWASRGIENICTTAVAISDANPKQIFTGYFDIGMWRSLDGGSSWQSCNTSAFTGAWTGHGGCAMGIVPDPSRANVVFAILGEEASKSTVIKNTNTGAASSWTAANGGLPAGFAYGLSLDRTSSSSSRTMFVTVNGDVYKSTNDGGSWTAVLTGGSCRVTAVDRFDGTIVYAGGEGGLWRSTSGGASGTWTNVGISSLSGTNSQELKQVQWEGVHAITPDPKLKGRVYVASYGAGRGVFRSDDRGSTWTQLHAGSYIREVAVDPSNNSVLYATSSKAYKAGGPVSGSEGVLRSADGGQSWNALNDGLAWPFAGPIAIDPGATSRIIAGSPGIGFYLRDLGSSSSPTADAARPAAVSDLGP